MKLILVRHGETEWNAREIVQGHKSVPLSRKGKSQARKVALRLKNEKIDAIYSSDLMRAKQTALEIARFHKVPVKYSKLIRERDYGKMEGMPTAEYKRLRTESGVSVHLYRPPGGESYGDMRKRIVKFLAMIRKKHINETVLVISHGGVIRVFIAILTKKPFDKIHELEKQRNTAVNVIEIKPGSEPKVHYLNSTEHL